MFPKRKEGFTLISALLVATLLITVSVAVSSIGLRRIRLSSAARESAKAFSAADSWLECITYHDLTLNAFEGTNNPESIECFNGQIIEVKVQESSNPFKTITFTKEVPNAEPCANATLIKSGNYLDDSEIIVRGYNTCDQDGSRRVERALKTTYR